MTGVTTSTIPAFKAALCARLQADPSLAGIQVFRLDPFPDQPADVQVVVNAAKPEDQLRDSTFGGGQTTAGMGGGVRRPREERYVVDVVCRVLRSDQWTAATAEDRAYELAAIVQKSLDAWAGEAPPFGGLVRVGLITATEDWHGLGDQKREARVVVLIACSARINLPT